MNQKPYKQKVLKEGLLLREFTQRTNSSDLIWHQDKKDRIVKVLKSEGWKLQLSKGLPFDLVEGKSYRIPSRSWHRVLKGKGELKILIKEHLLNEQIDDLPKEEEIDNAVLDKEVEDEISPVRFQFAEIDDIVAFVDDVLMNTTLSDISEKVAGQHLSVTIKNNFVYSQTKDAIIQGKDPKDARHAKFGSELLRAVIEVTKSQKIQDQVWRFELLHPKFNHDYIKYKNEEVVFIEYTGRLTDDLAAIIRSKMKNSKLLTRSDLKPRITDTDDLIFLRRQWNKSLRRKILSLKTAPESVKARELGRLKSSISKIIEDAFVSAVDNVSPVEGLVVKSSGKPFKISSDRFSKIQRIQLPIYSFFKLKKEEVEQVFLNPYSTINEIRELTGLSFSSIYPHNSDKSLFDTLKEYFEKASRFISGENDKIDVWLSQDDARFYSQTLTEENVIDIYKDLYSFVKTRDQEYLKRNDTPNSEN